MQHANARTASEPKRRAVSRAQVVGNATRRQYAGACERVARGPVARLGLVAEREERLVTAGLGAGARDGEDLVAREVGRLAGPRRLRRVIRREGIDDGVFKAARRRPHLVMSLRVVAKGEAVGAHLPDEIGLVLACEDRHQRLACFVCRTMAGAAHVGGELREGGVMALAGIAGTDDDLDLAFLPDGHIAALERRTGR